MSDILDEQMAARFRIMGKNTSHLECNQTPDYKQLYKELLIKHSALQDEHIALLTESIELKLKE